MGGKNIIENTVNAGRSYATAIKHSGVQRVVMLSSVGADFEGGTGPITGLHHIEKLYSQLADVAVTYLRAGYFYTNYYNDIPMIQHAGILGSNFAADVKLPLVHPADIAQAAADALEQNPTGHEVRYIVSDYVTAAEVASVFGETLGKTLPWVAFTDEQAMEGMTGAGLPEEMAGLYTEMGVAIREGKLQSDFEKKGAPQDGQIKIGDFAREYASRF
ncbi:NmrA-like family protein [compost metagenome]